MSRIQTHIEAANTCRGIGKSNVEEFGKENSRTLKRTLSMTQKRKKSRTEKGEVKD